MPLEFDATKELKHHVTVEVTIKHLNSLRLRYRVTLFLLRLAGAFCPIDLVILTAPRVPLYFYCQFCGRDTSTTRPDRYGFFVVACNHCNRQSLVDKMGDEPRIIPELEFEPLACECEYVKLYGFVPRSGCLLHDRV